MLSALTKKKRKSVDSDSDDEDQSFKIKPENISDEDEEEEESEEEEEEVEVDEEVEEEEEEVKEEEDEASKREIIRKLLEPFGRDQLIEITKEAALKNPSIIERIRTAAESDPTHRKIFVHGLSWDATKETLNSVFKQYGEMEQCHVVTDKITGKSKGYGFVLFKSRDAAQNALKEPQKKIGNRMAACQLASHGPVPNKPVIDSTGRKIFVNNVGQHINPEKLRAFFARFGEIEEGPLGYDKISGKFKGFALFVYKAVDGCKKALEEPIKQFEGCKLQCQLAVEGIKKNNNQVVGENLVVSSAVTGVLQPNNLPLTYPMGMMNPGIMNQNLNPAVFMAQNQGFGVFCPAPLSSSLSHPGLTPSLGNGLSPLVNRAASSSTIGLGTVSGFGGKSLINSISPSVIGSYDTQAALQGLGAYQNAQMSQISRSQPGSGIMPSYFGR